MRQASHETELHIKRPRPVCGQCTVVTISKVCTEITSCFYFLMGSDRNVNLCALDAVACGIVLDSKQ